MSISRALVPASLAMLLSAFCFASSSPSESATAQALKAFQANPVLFMNTVPPKLAPDGSPISPQMSPLSGIDADSASTIRRSLREQIILRSRPSFGAPIPDYDRAENLVDHLTATTLEQMETSHLRSYNLPVSPWSGSYWPLYRDSIAYRYADSSFPSGSNWEENSKYILSRLGRSTDPKKLSPAEKYDLLVGDKNQLLTHSNIEAGSFYNTRDGEVQTWMGICHGWAVASFMDPRPTHTISVTAADGSELALRPADVKALASLLWANADFDQRFIGSRCDTDHPMKDRNGRIMDPTCFGENPSTWHLAVVNQLGLSHRSLIIDVGNDGEVWNQPVSGYSYTYFNPQTLQPAASIAEATVAKARFTGDKFAPYRSPAAAYYVGVSMDVVYLSETSPSTSDEDSPSKDSRVTVSYLYDLELDANHKLVGGEWYRNAHPDFVWTAAPNAHAVSIGDSGLPTALWDGRTPLPEPGSKRPLKLRVSRSP